MPIQIMGSCTTNELTELVHNLQVYSVGDANGDMALFRYGRDQDGGYVVAEKSFQQADVLLSYGIAGDISFEEDFLAKHQKDVYGFDCGIDTISTTYNLFHFSSECLSTDSLLTQGQTSSQKVDTFSNQINKLGLQNQNMFIKMDIEGAEYKSWKDILPYAQHIQGIAMEMHISNYNMLSKAIELTANLNQHFYLLNVHGNNCQGNFGRLANSQDSLPYLLELSYINKNLVTIAELSQNQYHPSKFDKPNCPNKPEHTFDLTIKECS
jgi:hypothetical protein